MNSRSVSLQTRVTEIESPLPGSRAWVAMVIESGEIRIGHAKDGNSGVWLHWQPDPSKPVKSQCLAIRDAVRECGHNKVRVEAWPTDDDDYEAYCYGGQTWFRVSLTPAGEALARQFSRKARTLLRLALRRNDAQPEGRFRVKVERVA